MTFFPRCVDVGIRWCILVELVHHETPFLRESQGECCTFIFSALSEWNPIIAQLFAVDWKSYDTLSDSTIY